MHFSIVQNPANFSFRSNEVGMAEYISIVFRLAFSRPQSPVNWVSSCKASKGQGRRPQLSLGRKKRTGDKQMSFLPCSLQCAPSLSLFASVSVSVSLSHSFSPSSPLLVSVSTPLSICVCLSPISLNPNILASASLSISVPRCAGTPK